MDIKHGVIEPEGVGPTNQQRIARIINREFRKHLFGQPFSPITDRLWQLRQRRCGLNGQIWYGGDHPPTPDRPWWSLRNHYPGATWRPWWKV